MYNGISLKKNCPSLITGEVGRFPIRLSLITLPLEYSDSTRISALVVQFPSAGVPAFITCSPWLWLFHPFANIPDTT